MRGPLGWPRDVKAVFIFEADGDRTRELANFAEEIATLFGRSEAEGLLEGRYAPVTNVTLAIIDARRTEWKHLLAKRPEWRQIEGSSPAAGT